MRFTQSWLAIGALVVMGAFAVDSTAKPSLEERIDRVESLLQNKITVETLNEVEALKTEVQTLHGKLEEQQHAIEELKKSQEKLFLDLEQKINQSSGKAPAPNPYNYPSSSSNKYPPVSPAPAPANVKPTIPPPTPPSSAIKPDTVNTKSSASEQKQYNEAYKLVDAKRYKDAAVALQDFLWKYPDGQYAANANYWLGEIYLSEWHSDKANKTSLEKAINCFKTVTIKYSKHHKAADSLLKLGIIESEQENWLAAKEYFNQLKQKYPGSSRAHMADARLKNIK